MFRLFFLLILFVHNLLTPVLSCEIMHQMQSNALIYMCDASKVIPDNCKVFWQNNFLSFCISETYVNNNHSRINFTNYTYQNTTFDINQYISNFDKGTVATTTTSIPTTSISTTSVYTSPYYTNSTVAINDATVIDKSLPWMAIIGACFIISAFYGAVFAIVYCVKKRRKTSILPVNSSEIKQPNTKKRVKVVHPSIRPPSKYLHSVKQSNLSIEEVVQLKQILAKKKKKNRMKKYVRILPPIVARSKKIVPSFAPLKQETVMKDQSWRIPPV